MSSNYEDRDRDSGFGFEREYERAGGMGGRGGLAGYPAARIEELLAQGVAVAP